MDVAAFADLPGEEAASWICVGIRQRAIANNVESSATFGETATSEMKETFLALIRGNVDT